jgi:biotin transport system substrate-specific component
VWGAIAIFLAGEAVIYAVGLPLLASFLGSIDAPNDLASTLAAGFLPFIVGDVLKAALAGALLPLTWKLVNRTK